MTGATTPRVPRDGEARPGRVVGALVAGLALGAAAVLLVGAVAPGDDVVPAAGPPSPEPGSIEAVAAELAEAQREESAVLVADLVDAATIAHGDVEGVLRGLADVAPPGAATAAAAGSDELAGWRADLGAAREALEATGRGTDDQALTRQAFIGAVELLDDAVTAAGDADGEDRAATLTAQRTSAVDLWLAAAARLDGLALDAGGEHVHLFLAEDGDRDSVPLEFRGDGREDGHEDD
ncbi:hypothetical protein [Aquipuribacter nitratireducens]|uniref:DUF5667 domain-containing protein n=1 Tax=Aquipuribacter nitratireducens TaxID=650104 RepID=A0ABW0GJE3_9MICO